MNCPVCGLVIPQDADTCPSCGFKTKGVTQEFDPLEISSKLNDNKSASLPFIKSSLRVINSIHTQEPIYLKEGITTIGRNPQATIFLNNMTVSRTHAQIENNHNICVLKDLNSYNGVWVNNSSCAEKTLINGDVIQIGCYLLVFEQE